MSTASGSGGGSSDDEPAAEGSSRDEVVRALKAGALGAALGVILLLLGRPRRPRRPLAH
jgi:hypothetical protein